VIEVLALAGAVSQIAGSISSAVRAGKDVSDLLPHFGKLATLDSEIQLAEQGRHKGPLGRLSSSEEEGFAIASAKMKHKEAMDELRSCCMLFGPPGMWDMVIAEQANARTRRTAELKDAAAKRDKMFWIISLVCGIIVFALSTTLILYLTDMAVNG